MKNPTKRRNIKQLHLLRESGVKVSALENMPEVLPIYHVFWRAFQTLSSMRIQNEVGPQPIQLSEVRAYADLLQITDVDDREDLVSLLTVLDQIWLEHTYDAREKARKKARNEAKRKRAKPPRKGRRR